MLHRSVLDEEFSDSRAFISLFAQMYYSPHRRQGKGVFLFFSFF